MTMRDAINVKCSLDNVITNILFIFIVSSFISLGLVLLIESSSCCVFVMACCFWLMRVFLNDVSNLAKLQVKHIYDLRFGLDLIY